MKSKHKKVFIAMSGGVDSSVAALLLRDAGYDVTGVFMRCYNVDGCSELDAEDARRVAAHLEIPFYVFDFEEEYKCRVVEYMVQGYREGITPNPDVMCNKKIKFGLFLEKVFELGADYIATGHYVRRLPISRHRLSASSSGLPQRYVLGAQSASRNQACAPPKVAEKQEVTALYTARDLNKDQSYFLWTLNQKQLKYCLFPIGDYLKPEVREIARTAGLPTAEKKDSQGICFLGKVTLEDFLKNYIPEKRGEVLTTAGAKIGEHQGAHLYTIGERHIGVASRTPVYVADKDIKTNTVVVAKERDSPILYRKEIKLSNVNFINPITARLIRTNGGIEVLARVRYRQPLVSATLYNLQPTTYNLKFASPVKFVAPGQSAVFYRASNNLKLVEGYEILGGGVIL